MDFKIGVLADGFQLPFEQAIAESAKLGIDGVQIYAVSGDLAPDQVTPAILKEKTVIRFLRLSIFRASARTCSIIRKEKLEGSPVVCLRSKAFLIVLFPFTSIINPHSLVNITSSEHGIISL